MKSLLILTVALCAATSTAHAEADPLAPGRLFYTPAQRAQLEQMRAAPAARAQRASAEPAYVPPVRFDGMVVRSDGRHTRWVNGRAQLGNSGTGGLKPGQIRADGKVYEPYQVLPAPSEIPVP